MRGRDNGREGGGEEGGGAAVEKRIAQEELDQKTMQMYRRAKVATRNNKLQPQVPNVEPN